MFSPFLSDHSFMAVFFLVFLSLSKFLMLHEGKINAGQILTAGLRFPFCICFFFFLIGNKIIDAGLGHSACMQKQAGSQHL